MKRSIAALALVTLLAATAVGAVVRRRSLQRAEAEQVEACRALVHSEVVIWELEGQCLSDAQRILSRPDARRIAAELGTGRDARQVELRLREFLRIRRPAPLWEATKQAFVTFTPDSRAAATEAAVKAGLRPVDIMAEWMTYEGAVDLYLMDRLWADKKSLPATISPVADTFFAPGAPRPTGQHGVRIVRTRDDAIDVDVFGASVKEEWVHERPIEILGEGQAKIPWRSNYNYFRDAVRGVTPVADDLPPLVRSDDGFGVDYREWMAEYVTGGDLHPWATVMCLQGPLAAGAMYELADGSGGEKPKPEEKAVGEGKKE